MLSLNFIVFIAVVFAHGDSHEGRHKHGKDKISGCGISGVVLDSITTQAIEYVSISVIDKAPPIADSGETFKIEGLSEVPLCLPSPKVGKVLTPFFKSLSGGCILPTSADPG